MLHDLIKPKFIKEDEELQELITNQVILLLNSFHFKLKK